MAATKIKVTINSISVSRKSSFWGPGEWQFDASVKKLPGGNEKALGDKKSREARVGETIALGWSQEVELKPADQKIEINLSAKDNGLLFNRDLGTVRIVLLSPISYDYTLSLVSSHSKRYFSVSVKIEILQRTPGIRGKITTIRESTGASTFGHVHEQMPSKLVHLCPVIPVPWATGIPPIPKGMRSPSVSASPQLDLHINAASKGQNALVNPGLIPVIATTDKDFDQKCARIFVTQFRPAKLDLTKLIWIAVTPNVRFMDGKLSRKEIIGGREVHAYGILKGNEDEPCTIEIRWDSPARPLLATYSAVVGKIKYIWCRANIIKCSQATIGGVAIVNPSFTAATVKAHIDFTNKILWQAGLQIAFDSDETPYNGAKMLKPGIFEVSSATNHTFNVVKNRRIVAPLLNSRDGVFNLAYLHSCRGKPNLLGSATDRRLSDASKKVNSNLTPSTSWVRPTGIWPDKDSETISMETMGPSAARDADLKAHCGDGAMDKLSACIITENCKANITVGEVTLPHELGHVIGLHHRGSGTPIGSGSRDGVNHLSGPLKDNGHPWNENLMSYGNDQQAQDIDLIQLAVVRAHPLLKASLPPAKVTKKTVPVAGLPTTPDITLAQEYLGGTRPGLKHSGYPLGTSGSNSDGVDGVFGPKTRAAVRSFQSDHGTGLGIDGIYGPNTHAAFNKELNP